MCDRTHAYVCHDSFICATWFMYVFDMTHSLTHIHESSIYMIYVYVRYDHSLTHSHIHDSCISSESYRWFMYMFDMTHSHSHIVPGVAFTDGIWLIHMYEERNDSSTCVTWLIHMCDMTHLYVRNNRATGSNHKCDMTHSYVWIMWVTR